MIELESVSKRFGAVEALSDASLSARRGELLAVLGPSGCGKSTMLRVIAGFEWPDSGTVRLDGRAVSGPAWVPPERRHVGMVFQDYALFPHLTVEENVGYGLPRRGRRSRVRSRPRPGPSCSTSRGAASTRSCARRCATRSRRSCAPPESPSSS